VQRFLSVDPDLDGKEGIWGAAISAGADWLAQGVVSLTKNGDTSLGGYADAFIHNINWGQVVASGVQGGISVHGTMKTTWKAATVLGLEIYKAGVEVTDDNSGARAFQTESFNDIGLKGSVSQLLGDLGGLATDRIIKEGGIGAIQQARTSLDEAIQHEKLTKAWQESDPSIGRTKELAKDSGVRKDAFKNLLEKQFEGMLVVPLEKAPVFKEAIINIGKAPLINQAMDAANSEPAPTIRRKNSDGVTRTMQYNKDDRVYEYHSTTPNSSNN